MTLKLPLAPGSQPPGTTDEAAAARWIQKLFSDIAGRYDFLNHLLSLNADRYWRRQTARQFDHLLSKPGARVLDLCCGTADLGLAFSRRGSAPVFFCDFSYPMLVRAQDKLRRHSLSSLVAQADALSLPFPDNAFDLVACSFGFRNLVNYDSGLREIWRILRTGGEVGILEFSEPNGSWMRPLYTYYFHRVLPAVGEWISGVQGSYSYLPDSVGRFPGSEEFARWMETVSFEDVRARRFMGGIAVLYSGTKTSA
ncbi:MAG: ubiquinone/menaquinone biosynthesis methyltransferase [Acidobacteria bacterium]|nr:ubiquinone/menaquinone biosynthesis methyltransferase [Acidobacteriota bacterium]